VDGDTPDTKFSTIASNIKKWRDVIAHRWLNVSGYKFNYDFTMQEGWKKEGGVVVLNPQIYLNHYLAAFGANGKIYHYEKILTTPQELKEAENRFLSKYIEEK
jgi:hypothetical protein